MLANKRVRLIESQPRFLLEVFEGGQGPRRHYYRQGHFELDLLAGELRAAAGKSYGLFLAILHDYVEEVILADLFVWF